jgi:hypothetical protein
MNCAYHEILWSDLQESFPHVRHLVRRHHFLTDHVEKGDIEMRYIDIERQLDNIFTKALDAS